MKINDWTLGIKNLSINFGMAFKIFMNSNIHQLRLKKKKVKILSLKKQLSQRGRVEEREREKTQKLFESCYNPFYVLSQTLFISSSCFKGAASFWPGIGHLGWEIFPFSMLAVITRWAVTYQERSTP